MRRRQKRAIRAAHCARCRAFQRLLVEIAREAVRDLQAAGVLPKDVDPSTVHIDMAHVERILRALEETT